MKCAVLLPDGRGVRNFLLGGFLDEWKAAGGETIVLHTIPDDLLADYRGGSDDGDDYRPLHTYRESALSSTLRYSLAYGQMWWGDTHAMRRNRSRPVNGSWRTQRMHDVARLVGRAAAAARRLEALDRWHCDVVSRLPDVDRYRRLFEETRPDVLFCTHHRPLGVLPPVLAARALGIPTATFIFSWDNLSSKGRIAAPFDHYLVWSEHMRQELLRFYPDVSAERVHIVGSPQFDPYAEPALLWTRDEFAARVGADPSRPLICYSGCDASIYAEEPLQIKVLLDHVRAGRIHGRPQVLLRPTPTGDPSRYAALRRAYPELLVAEPAWRRIDPRHWDAAFPLAADVQFLVNLTRHADLNVNLGSTMTLDFAMHDKPVVNVAFDVSDPPPLGRSLWDYYYCFEHYQPVLELGAARVARTAAQLAEHVNAYLDNPSLDRDNRRRLVDLQVGCRPGASTAAIVSILQTLGGAAEETMTHPTTEDRIDAYLGSHGVSQPARTFVPVVSNVYHRFESQVFDDVHKEIIETAGQWQAALERIAGQLPARMRVLDVGAGTGFATAQVLRVLGSRIYEVVCLDLSVDMLKKCRARVEKLTPNGRFVVGQPECLLRGAEQFDLVVTSAMLHHLLDLPGFLGTIRQLVRPGGFYLAGHEPSHDFYATPELYRWTRWYRSWKRMRALVSAGRWVRRLRGRPGTPSLDRRTNEALMRMGVIREPLPPGVVSQLVDIHVPPSREGVPFWGEAGFKPEDICDSMLGGFSLEHLSTYPHVKDARERMGPVWRTIDRWLASRYPAAGANFWMAARRRLEHAAVPRDSRTMVSVP
jgi:ubiquinone/menaquinone biosynthesis C-methylase UbiE